MNTPTTKCECDLLQIADINPDAVVFDGFDDAIIGIGASYPQIPVLVYSQEKIINILIEDHGLSDQDAFEYYEFNMAGLYAGEHTPIIMSDLCC